MNKQEIFDKVAKHLIQQGCASVHEELNECRYRTDEGLMCAVGCLIPDEIYKRNMEGLAAEDLLRAFPEVEEFLGVEVNEDRCFISTLQHAHDNHLSSSPKGMEAWKTRMCRIAEEFSLDCSVLYN